MACATLNLTSEWPLLRFAVRRKYRNRGAFFESPARRQERFLFVRVKVDK
jgi:hypothetical protein